jgi:RNase P subunit RPR2
MENKVKVNLVNKPKVEKANFNQNLDFFVAEENGFVFLLIEDSGEEFRKIPFEKGSAGFLKNLIFTEITIEAWGEIFLKGKNHAGRYGKELRLKIKNIKDFYIFPQETDLEKRIAFELKKLNEEKKKLEWKIHYAQKEKEAVEKTIKYIRCKECEGFNGTPYPICSTCAEAEKEKLLISEFGCKECGKRNDRLADNKTAHEIVFDPNNGRYFKKICSRCIGLHRDVTSLGGGCDNLWRTGAMQKDPGFYSKMK